MLFKKVLLSVFAPIGIPRKPAGLCGMWVIDCLTTALLLLMSPNLHRESALHLACVLFPVPAYQLQMFQMNFGSHQRAQQLVTDVFISLLPASVLSCCRVWPTKALPVSHLRCLPHGGDIGLCWSPLKNTYHCQFQDLCSLLACGSFTLFRRTWQGPGYCHCLAP